MIFFIGTGIALIRFVFFVVFISIAMMLFSFAGNRRESPKRFLVFSQLCVFFGNIALAAVGIYKVQLYGEKVAPRSKCKLIISNHNCAIEVILIWVLSHFPSFVSRRENCKFPFFSGIIKACDGVLVDRSSASSRQRTLEAIIEHAEDPSSSQLIIFPEGTTGNQRTLFLFRKGAFEAGVPVQMICVYFPYKHFNPAWTGRETGGNNLKDIALRLCSQFVTHAEVRVLPVYYPTEEEKANAIVYANHCQKMMACVLKEKVSDATTKYAKEAAAAYEQKRR
ncbi:lysophosphatidylcholine acyltransferase [Angomonas deanei]|uniref:Acyltransferase, putative n=1 Tax=Angomonas deanei TaxID=59799 RepID=A0A7G2CFM7_9TRYP|nr:lysophosphatidylcholine acyltransferase [Angomonas deanei]CAD2218630.1 Acyltransferase, putative [Angomonas deanei]|eukprot:EPY38008.1 lysophosphatidylcholine acyltransferase [Angomonas deanei]